VSTEEVSVLERVTVTVYDTTCGPRFLMLTQYQGIRTAGTDTEPYTSGVTVLRDDTEAEEFVGVEADLPEFLEFLDRLLTLDLPHVDVPEHDLWNVHPMAAILQLAARLGVVQSQ
jgi:hypothetical protein